MRREAEMRAWAMQILEALELAQFANELPGNLPYGIQRRVEIARALSIRPDLLMLDEPAAGLNSADVEGLITLIRWIHKEFKLSIWMIEHQMDVVMSLCTWIKVIDFGATIAEGTPARSGRIPWSSRPIWGTTPSEAWPGRATRPP
jgi:branched-chain amino acid transport system ATP-binding protein